MTRLISLGSSGWVNAGAHRFRTGADNARDEPRLTAAAGWLQGLINATPSGGVLDLSGQAPCVVRESVTVSQPITIDFGATVQIRGSDVWDDAVWTYAAPSAGYYRSTLSTPSGLNNAAGACDSRHPLCVRQEQVYLNGAPLAQIADNTLPANGQFSIYTDTGGRNVVIRDIPLGNLMEVAMRKTWLAPASGKVSNVTIRNLTAKHSTTDAQAGALTNMVGSSFGDHWTIEYCTLAYSRYAAVSLDGDYTGATTNTGGTNGVGCILRFCDIHHNGCLGVHGSGGVDLVVSGNTIHHNNILGCDAGNEAGGMKVTRTLRGQWLRNDAYENYGPGLWWDIYCTGAEAGWNRCWTNTGAGLMYEISISGTLHDNLTWDNGFIFDTAWWSAGILVSTSSSVAAYSNVVAWNGQGLNACDQLRSGTPWMPTATAVPISDLNFHDNILIGVKFAELLGAHAGSPTFADGAHNVRGGNNQFYCPSILDADHSTNSFAYYPSSGSTNSMTTWNGTVLGGGASSWLTGTAASNLLAANGMPTSAPRQKSTTVTNWNSL